jgi:hypothetical protein
MCTCFANSIHPKARTHGGRPQNPRKVRLNRIYSLLIINNRRFTLCNNQGHSLALEVPDNHCHHWPLLDAQAHSQTSGHQIVHYQRCLLNPPKCNSSSRLASLFNHSLITEASLVPECDTKQDEREDAQPEIIERKRKMARQLKPDVNTPPNMGPRT